MLNKNLKKLLVLAALSYSGIAFAAAADLPPELWQDILARLEGQSLARASEVCQQWHELTKAERAKEKQLRLAAERWIAEPGKRAPDFVRVLVDDTLSKELIIYLLKNYLILGLNQFHRNGPPIFIATFYMRSDLVELLLSLGNNPDVETGQPLYDAVMNGSVAIVEALLRAGVNRNIFTPRGKSLLEVARELRDAPIKQSRPDEVERFAAIIRLLEEK